MKTLFAAVALATAVVATPASADPMHDLMMFFARHAGTLPAPAVEQQQAVVRPVTPSTVARLPMERPHIAVAPKAETPVVMFETDPFIWRDQYSDQFRGKFGGYGSLGPAWLQIGRYRI